MKFVLNIDPRPQSRTRFTRFGKPYEVAEMKLWRNQCKFLIANQYIGQPMLEGALRARVRFFIEPPQYISNRKRTIRPCWMKQFQ